MYITFRGCVFWVSF